MAELRTARRRRLHGAVRAPADPGHRDQQPDRRRRPCRLLGVEVRELPDVDRPVITVTTNYDGAAAETVDREVTGSHRRRGGPRLRRQSISSRSSFGRSRVTVEFNDGVDLNVAASDMRDSIGRVINQLPDDADEPRIVKADANADAVIRLAVTSDTMSVEDLTTSSRTRSSTR